jgi:hypothetical protein
VECDPHCRMGKSIDPGIPGFFSKNSSVLVGDSKRQRMRSRPRKKIYIEKEGIDDAGLRATVERGGRSEIDKIRDREDMS